MIYSLKGTAEAVLGIHCEKILLKYAGKGYETATLIDLRNRINNSCGEDLIHSTDPIKVLPRNKKIT